MTRAQLPYQNRTILSEPLVISKSKVGMTSNALMKSVCASVVEYTCFVLEGVRTT